MSECQRDRIPAIDCRGLGKVYRRHFARHNHEVCAVQDVSFSVDAGRIVGLIGVNGAGKSTLLGLIAGLYRPIRGNVRVLGYPARSLEARRQLGFMPESSSYLASHNTVSAVLRYHGALLGLSGPALKREVDRLGTRLELSDIMDRACNSLSLGMRQRLSLAIAFLNTPRVLLLDEPSNGLDPIGIVHLRTLLLELRSSGTAILVSSHRLAELERLTTDYLCIHNGRLVELGDPLMARRTKCLRIQVLSGGCKLAPEVLSRWRPYDVSDTELTVEISDDEDAPKVVTQLVRAGAQIMGVVIEKQSVEDMFLHAYEKRDAIHEGS